MTRNRVVCNLTLEDKSPNQKKINRDRVLRLMHTNSHIFKVNKIVQKLNRMKKDALEDEDSRYNYAESVTNPYSDSQYCFNVANQVDST